MRKNNRGITLVALVITIIILLILAGITISQLTGSGLFENARLAEEKYSNAEKYEKEELAKLTNNIDKYIGLSREENGIKDYKENLICEYNMSNIIDGVLMDNSGKSNNANFYGTGYEIKSENGKEFLRLDGTTYAQTQDFTSLVGNNEKTIMCCFRVDEDVNNNYYPYIIGLGDDDENNGGFPIRLTPEGYIYFATGNNVNIYNAKTHYVADNNWHFVCLTFDKKTLVLYLDNKIVYANNLSLGGEASKFTIGAHPRNRSFLKGDISNVRIYDKGLNYEEVYRAYINIKR